MSYNNEGGLEKTSGDSGGSRTLGKAGGGGWGHSHPDPEIRWGVPKIILFRLEGPQFAVDNVVGYPKHNSSH